MSEVTGIPEQKLTKEGARKRVLRGVEDSWHHILNIEGSNLLRNGVIEREGEDMTRYVLSLQPGAVGRVRGDPKEKDVNPGETDRMVYVFCPNEIRSDEVPELVGDGFNEEGARIVAEHSRELNPVYYEPVMDVDLGEGLTLHAGLKNGARWEEAPRIEVGRTWVTVPLTSKNHGIKTGMRIVTSALEDWKENRAKTRTPGE
jgi:hypothetical protein